MNKKSILYIILDLIFIVIFNTVFFMLGGTEHTASVWISWGFIHLSYIMVLLTPFLVRNGSNAAIFGLALSSISAVYFFAEFIVGLIFILIGSESYKAALIVQLIVAGIYGILLIANMIANEHTADNTDRREQEVDYIKTASSRIKMLLDKTDDKKANKKIEKAYDLIHSSPTKSVQSVSGLETYILSKIDDLEREVYANSVDAVVEIAGEIVDLAEERNRKIKLEK